MTGRNPHTTEGRAVDTAKQMSAVGYGFVTNVDPEDFETKHIVDVQPAGSGTHVSMQVPVMSEGDMNVPVSEDVPVLFARKPGERPVILSIIYTPEYEFPEYEPGERILGHPVSDSFIKFGLDGNITIESDGGATVEYQSDGTVVINGGDQGVITDITTTKDADGHVTSISLIRNNDILV